MLDLVYPLSPGPLDYSELRYSLRSVEANTGAQRVHFFGGRPDWLKTGLHVKTHQPYDKWTNARIQLRLMLESTEVSDPFWFMNDDFYFLDPVGDAPPIWHGGPFGKWLEDLGPRYTNSQYMKDAKQTISALLGQGVRDPICWSLHTPIPVYKSIMHEALAIDLRHDRKLHLRTLYGNLARDLLEMNGAIMAPYHDVKQTTKPKPGQVYASTSNSTWDKGALGRHIRERFPNPSRWER